MRRLVEDQAVITINIHNCNNNERGGSDRLTRMEITRALLYAQAGREC